MMGKNKKTTEDILRDTGKLFGTINLDEDNQALPISGRLLKRATD